MAGDLCAPPLAFVKIFFDLRCETRSPGGILFSWHLTAAEMHQNTPPSPMLPKPRSRDTRAKNGRFPTFSKSGSRRAQQCSPAATSGKSPFEPFLAVWEAAGA